MYVDPSIPNFEKSPNLTSITNFKRKLTKIRRFRPDNHIFSYKKIIIV